MTRAPSPELVDPVTVGLSAERLEQAKALMDDHVSSGRTPAAALFVARHGRPVLGHAVGAVRPGGPPLELDHLFPIASQTKPITSAVVLALAERGLVGLSEPAAVHLPELAADHGDVLVVHLLTHTSGWHDEDHVAAREAKLEAALASVPEGSDPLTHILVWPGWGVERRHAPGEMMQYCGWNYDALGEIVRRVTGDTMDRAMRDLVFDPVGMADSALIVGAELADRIAQRPSGIPFGPDHPDTPIDFNSELWRESDSGASGGHSTVVDLVRFGQMILDRGRVGDGRVLSDAAVEALATDRIPGVPGVFNDRELAAGSWSLGFSVAGSNHLAKFGSGIGGPDVLRHGGAGGSQLWIDPASQIVGAYVELATSIDDMGVPTSWIAHRVEAAVTAAVVD